MKLNNKQSFAILHALKQANLINDWLLQYNLMSISALFDGEEKEVRIIARYGMAGKLWNNNDAIYVTGHNESEVDAVTYKREQKEITEINSRIKSIVDFYKDEDENPMAPQ